MKKPRNTQQRTVILEILRAGFVHLTADEIYQTARKRIPTVSLGTVYRNLNYLRREGLVREVRSGESGCARFEAARDAHGHFHCRVCGKVLDMALPAEIAGTQWCEAGQVSSVSFLDLHVIGNCSECPVE